VSPPPRAWLAEKADAQEKQMREDHVTRRRAEPARRAREAAHERSLQADQAPQQDTQREGAEHRIDRGAG
jgi:hypothetical protein